MATSILVVEDDETQRALLREVLGKEGRLIVEAVTALEGLNYAKDHPVDVLMLDLHLPGKFDGFSLCEELRKDPRHARLKVVVISGYADPLDRIDAARLKVDRYFLKPVDVWELAKALDDLESE